LIFPLTRESFEPKGKKRKQRAHGIPHPGLDVRCSFPLSLSRLPSAGAKQRRKGGKERKKKKRRTGCGTGPAQSEMWVSHWGDDQAKEGKKKKKGGSAPARNSHTRILHSHGIFLRPKTRRREGRERKGKDTKRRMTGQCVDETYLHVLSYYSVHDEIVCRRQEEKEGKKKKKGGISRAERTWYLLIL